MSHDHVDLSDPAVVAHELVYLHQKLSKKYRHVDAHLLDASIEDALLYHRRRPQCFDVPRGVPLLYYLELRARSFLDKRLRKEKCHRKHEKAAGVSDKIFEKIVSEMGARRGIYRGKDRTEQETEERREEFQKRRNALDAFVARLNPRDRAGVRFMREGASFKKWVRHLGIEDLSLQQQRRKVNAEKNRLKKRLWRWAQKMRG